MKTTKEILEPYHDFISTVYKVESELTKSIDIITSVKSLEAYETYVENICNNEYEAEALKPKLEKYRKLYHDKLRGATTFHLPLHHPQRKLNKVK